MIDLHCHLLGGANESQEGFAEQLEICRRAAQDGVHTLVATPRWASSQDEPPLGLSACWQQLERLRQEMRAALSFKLGFLMEFRRDLPEVLEKYGSAVTLGGGRFAFVSVPALHLPADAEEVWSKVSRKGFSVLLARAECCLALRRNPVRLERFVESGGRLQLDAASITGLHGHEIQHFAFQCLKKYEGSVIVASTVGGRSARSSSLALVREELLKKNQAQRVKRLLCETPLALLGETKPSSPDAHLRAFRLPQLLRPRSLRSQRVVPDES